jgi:2-polyprenyl-6-methoxyphenol hydroxylase-like FAD-dependent oxidoreductase
VNAQKHVEIAGGGMGGMAAAIAFAQQGWSVRVHERSPELRAHGSAIYLSENGLLVLEALGAYEGSVADSFQLKYRETRDGHGRLISFYDWTGDDADLRQFMMLRKNVLESLAASAAGLGVEVCLGSEVSGADPQGALLLGDGRALSADLVIAADGVNSQARANLDLMRSRHKLRDGSIRMLLPVRHAFPWDNGVFAEYWSGRRRCFVVPCGRDDFYLGFVVLQSDTIGRQVPIDKDAWIVSLPALEHFIERVDNQERWSWDQYETVKLRQWHRGRVVVLGDAAHAMCPNFGQGAGLAMGAALSLTTHLAEEPDLHTALTRWEARERPMIERIQFLSALYSKLMSWPQTARDLALATMGRSGWVMKQRTQASYYRPYGLAERVAAAKRS